MSPCLSLRTRSPALLSPFTLDSYIEHRRTFTTLVVCALAVAHIATIQHKSFTLNTVFVAAQVCCWQYNIYLDFTFAFFSSPSDSS